MMLILSVNAFNLTNQSYYFKRNPSFVCYIDYSRQNYKFEKIKPDEIDQIGLASNLSKEQKQKLFVCKHKVHVSRFFFQPTFSLRLL